MKVLVTGADGFVGSWLVPRLRQEGHVVVAALRPAPAIPSAGMLPADVPRLPLELGDPGSIRAAVGTQRSLPQSNSFKNMRVSISCLLERGA